MDNMLEFLIKPTGSRLMADLKRDLDCFFSKEACENHCSPTVFGSEADIQVRLVGYLKSLGNYNGVMVEYKLPKEIYETRLSNLGFIIPSPIYPWHNHIRIDIVVEKDGEFALIELKYATAFLQGQNLFGEKINYKYLTNHDASNLIMYNFWKDVRRIEMSSLVFKNIVGGFAILVTNNDTFINQPQPTAAYKEFSTYNGRTVGEINSSVLLDWNQSNRKIKETIRKNYPEFIIDGLYTCDWKPTCLRSAKERNGNFDYLMIEVNKVPINLYGPHKFVVGQQTTVEALVDWFKKETNLVLKVYKGRRILDKSELLINHGGKKDYISFRMSRTVQSLENEFKEKLNLDVKIFTKDEWVHVLPGITLATASQIPAGATKKSMADLIGYKRKDS